MSFTYSWETQPSTPEPWVPAAGPSVAMDWSQTKFNTDTGNSGVRKTPDSLTDPVAERFFSASVPAQYDPAQYEQAHSATPERISSLDSTNDDPGRSASTATRWRWVSLGTLILGGLLLGAFVWRQNGGVIPEPAPVGRAVAVLPSSVPEGEPTLVPSILAPRDAIPKNSMQVAPTEGPPVALPNPTEAQSAVLTGHDVPWLLARAEVLRSSSGVAEAETIYRHLTITVPRNPHGWSGLAEVLFQQQHYAQAALCAEQAVRLRPSRRSYQRLRDSIRAAERSHR